MNGHATISEMMQSYADDAVRLASTFGAVLDYSESSLTEVERILTELYTRQSAAPHQSARDQNSPVQAQLDSISRVWGAYFGETIRRLWGGDWGVETYPGSIAPVVSVDFGGAKIFPVMKAYRRLTMGASENVWDFYRMIRAKLAPANQQTQ
jgi:hypothetical protein